MGDLAPDQFTCAYCHVQANQRCTGCHETFYCSREHQKLHWKKHKNHCCAFKVRIIQLIMEFLLTLCVIWKDWNVTKIFIVLFFLGMLFKPGNGPIYYRYKRLETWWTNPNRKSDSNWSSSSLAASLFGLLQTCRWKI